MQLHQPGLTRQFDARLIHRHRPDLLRYFSLTFFWSWSCWIAAALAGQAVPRPIVEILHALGGLGPMVITLALLFLTQDQDEQRQFRVRLTDWRRISSRWYAIILLTIPGIALAAMFTGRIVGGTSYSTQALASLMRNPTALLGLITTTLFFGPVPEELGWRGYALPRLQARWGSLRSSLVLALFWALWHLPLFFIPGTYQQADLNSWALRLTFFLGIVNSSVLITWISENTAQSILAAILAHFMENLTGQLLRLPADLSYYRTGWASLVSLVIIVGWLYASRHKPSSRLPD